ncbi:hypothetical protein GmHk_20G057714 [Glycine max]|nr:hypothetical protein GmHk_20G057714 [Glycine max]
MAEATRPKTRMEHIEEAIAKLDSNQLRVTTKLDELIQHITALEALDSVTHAYSVVHANSAATPRTLTILFLMLVPHLDTNSKHQVPHVLSSIFNQLGHAHAIVSLDNLLSIVVHYSREAASHDKLLEHRDMALFERGVVPYGSAMVARKRQPVAFALGTAADPKESRRYKPWDPGGPWWTRNTLRTRCF